MWLYLSLFLLCQRVYGYNIGDEMTEIIQRCCNDGSKFATNHTQEACSAPQPVPSDVPSTFSSLCLIATSKCCTEYFEKKRDCDLGIDIATNNNKCDLNNESAKTCCKECTKGKAIGEVHGERACVAPKKSSASAEDLLSGDAFVQCCLRAARGGSSAMNANVVNVATTTKKPEVIASMCEEFAPNELCAHHCIPIPGSYKCECNPGFMLMADGRNCMEVTKNRCKPKNPCQHKCNDNGVDVLCSCRRGYELMPDGTSCQDINECQLDIPVCLPGTKCQNIQGSYKCIPDRRKVAEKGQCPPGFARNLKNNACDDINECALPKPPCPKYACENTIGGYKCGGVNGDPVNLSTSPRSTPEDNRCPSGFMLGVSGICEDVDECVLHTDDCNHLSQFCINTHGSFFCQNMDSTHCLPGFKINARRKCEDINECDEDSEICRSDQTCVNHLGAYDCKQKVDNRAGYHEKCPDGMRRNPNTQHCEDIDECVEGTHLCDQHQNCLNTNGSFECHCKLGYELDTTTGACIDVNECATGQHDCLMGSQRCDNTVGSFLCIRITSCGTGYILQHSTGACEDVDECAFGTHNCARAGPEYQCMNIPGSFRCVKKRSSTTTTTALPEYEYVYYDSEEEFDDNGSNNAAKPNAGSPATTKPDSHDKNPSPNSTPIESPQNTPETNNVDIPKVRNPTSTEIPKHEEPGSTESTYYERTRPTESTQERSRPEYERPEVPPYEREQPTTTKHEEYKPTGPNYYETRPTEPETSKYDVQTPESPRDYEQKPEPPRYDERKPEPPRYDERKPEPPTYDENKPTAPTYDQTRQEEPRYNEQRPETPTYDQNRPEEPRYNEHRPETPTYDQNRPEEPRYNEHRPEIPTYDQHSSEEPRYNENRPVTPTHDQNSPEQPTYNEQRPKHDESQHDPRPDINRNDEHKHPRSDVSRHHNIPQVPKQDTPVTINRRPSENQGINFNDDNEYYDNKLEAPEENEIVPVTTKQQRPQFRPTEAPSTDSPSSTYPSAIYVNVQVQPETATIKGERKEDGSVVLDTNKVPKNKWTKVKPKPNDCPIGFEPNDYGGCFDIDECVTNQHTCSGISEICRNTLGGYLCVCAPEFRRDLVSGSCDLIVASTSSTEPPTPKDRLFWGYRDDKQLKGRPFRSRFSCDAGYKLNLKSGQCEDINECQNGQATCASVEICVNTQGGYRCECPPNWILDEVGHRCVPARDRNAFPQGYGNVPTSPQPPRVEVGPPVNPEITHIEDTGTVLKCPWGYRLGDDHICVDVDECQSGAAKCGASQICTNLPGGYSCGCPLGHRLVGDHECEDINECAVSGHGNMSVCSEHADCINTIGSYICRCRSGFRSAPYNDKVCMDIDECSEKRAGALCQQRCNNVWGSYTCSCHRGYRLNQDNRTCSDVDECIQFKSKIPCVGKCFNEPGSYKCSCPPGYRLSEDKRSCIDIDECETGEATCQNGMYSGSSHVCFNTRGSYRCHRITCPAGYQLESKHRCSKTERVCRPGDWECAHQPTTISYNFITFVSKLYIPESNVKLFTMRGPSWPYAKMKFELRLVDVNAPPSVKDRADINAFLLIQNGNEAVMSLVRPLEGPQSIELELSMELYSRDQFGGIAVAKLFIHVSEYEF